MIKMTQCENNTEEYPTYVCDICAILNGGKWPVGHVATFHHGKCGWCGDSCSITSTREYGYPNFKG
jgi:hypothetical protein